MVGSVLFFLALILQSACTTTPKSEPTVMGPAGSAEGQWRGKAMVRNNKTGKSGILNVDILAREPSQLRMELTGSFGVHVASIAMNGNEVNSILTQERRFVSSPATSDALTRLVPVRIPPRALMAVLFERALPIKEWKCMFDEKTNLPSICSHRTENVMVKWLERSGRNRRLKIAAAEAEIEMVIDESKSKVEMNESAFSLSPPVGYKVERIGAS